jgi:hypothetical protein
MTKQTTFGWSRISFAVTAVGALVAASLSVGCEKGGVGDPCIPEDEYQNEFGGYSETEVNIESRSFQCETRVCLVNHFRGRVSCPYGQLEMEGKCKTPDGTSDIKSPVAAQLKNRPPSSAVYCSCRCGGSQKEAPYCECPSGFECKNLIDDIGLGNSQLAGSYCVKTGTSQENIPTTSKCTDNPSSSDYCGAADNFYR